MNIQYASFTDKQIVYESGSSGALLDLTDKLYFEAAHTQNDQVVYETDPDGVLVPFQSGQYSVNGQDVTYVTSSVDGYTAFTGSIDLISEAICNNATDHFRALGILGTRDLFKEDMGATFKLNETTASFYVNDDGPLNESTDITEISQDDIPNLFQSNRFSHLSNFKFLPPMSKAHAEFPDGKLLGDYNRINGEGTTDWDTVEDYLSNFECVSFNFEDTSGENNLLCQIFEEVNTGASGGTLEKLVIVDYGSFQVESDRTAHVVFAGKLYRDSVGALTFANLLTLVFDDEAD